MYACSLCGYQNPNGAEFCLKCGGALELSCPNCDQPVPAGSKFCNHCGLRLPARQTAASATPDLNEREQSLRALMPVSLSEKIKTVNLDIIGERREITVLFLDIANFTATAHALDSEEIYLLTDEAMRLWAEVIYQYEGTIDKFIGDGLLALFGLPITHENDPERAVRAALDMQEALQPLQQRLKQTHSLEFQARIGIHTGLVIAGQIGNDLHMEYTVIGDTVNLAYRLQGAADSGTVIVSFATYQRTRPLFRYKTLPPVEAKGKPKPIPAFRPLGLRTRPGQIRGLPGLQVPMIGRKDALDQLQSTLTEMLRCGHSQVALVTGEAGVGKSRLVVEFRRALAQAEVEIYQGSCATYAVAKPLWLVANLLRDMLHLLETDSTHEQYETLQAYLDQLGLNQDGIRPYLANVLGLAGEDPNIEARLHQLDNAALQKLTYAAIRETFLTESHLSPTILVFDDLHWVDSASLDFLEYLAQSVDDVPLMLVLISRDAERHTVLQPLIAAIEKRRSPMTDIQLRPLTTSEGQLLVSRFIKQTTDMAQTLKHRIAERAEGNPFYAEEIIRMLIEQGGLTSPNGGWKVTTHALELVQEVPGTLNGLILARFDRLPEGLRRTIQKASVLGSSFTVELLAGLDGIRPENIIPQLEDLKARQFLANAPSGSENDYIFRHTLIQEVVYSTLLKRDRKKIHELAAQAVKRGKFWAPDERTEAMAYHYVRSANPDLAVPHLILAGESAARRCAYETAIQHFRKAMTLMKDQSSPHASEFLQVQMGLGQALKFVGAYPEASQVLDGVLQSLLGCTMKVDSITLLPILIQGLRELADIRVREGRPDEAAEYLIAGLEALGDDAAQAQPRLWRLLVDRLAWVRFRQGKLDEAFTLASSATLGVDSAPENDPVTQASLCNTVGGIFWQWGNLSEAAVYVERSLEAYKTIDYGFGMAIAYTNLGVLNFAQGNWSQATEYFEQAYALRRGQGYLPEQALNLNNLGLLHMAMGDHAQAQQDLEASLDIRKRLGEDFGVVVAQIGLAHLAVIQGRFREAAELIQVALRAPDAAGEYQAIQARWLWALIQAELGDPQAGLETAEEALRMAREAGLTEAEADCRRALGTLRTRIGQTREAEAILQEAIDLYLQLNAPYGQALTLLELGRLYQSLAQAADSSLRQEWQGKALTAFDNAIRHFESLGAAYDLQEAQAALNRLRAEIEIALPTDAHQASPAQETPLTHGQKLPEGEWHTAALVWLNLAPPPKADEEAVFETMAYVIPSLTAIAREHHGQVIRRQDGLTVVFGAPTAFEDDAERAVRTGWEMARRLQEIAPQREVPLTFGLAVSQGEVVAGRIGAYFHTEFTVKGKPVQTAQRIAETAPAGLVWVTEEVRTATERVFTYQPAPVDVLTDLQALSLFELTGWQKEPGPARGLPGLKASFIGRETPLLKMNALSENLSQGVGGVAWIEGEPGIGKSRLMREFARSVSASDYLFWQGGCSPQKEGQAFSLFSDLLSQALGLHPTTNAEEIRAWIRQAVQAWPKDAQVVRPYLEALFGLEPGGLEGLRLNNLEPEQLRQQIFVAMRRLFKTLASQQPLVLLLDDLHWIDPISAELLQFLIPTVASVPIMFVCAQRRQGSDAPNDRLLRAQGLITTQAARITLSRLTNAESRNLLGELLPQIRLPAQLESLILERSEGNPYFIEEYVRMLIEQGHVQHEDGQWVIDTQRGFEDLPLPTTLETLIRSRIDALPPELKQVLQYAAVIGASFTVSLLESIVELPDLKKALTRLESRLLLRRSVDGGLWEFNHSLIETVAYSTMLRMRRREIHIKLAQVLEQRWLGTEAEHAEELAYHYTKADEDMKALAYLVLAGERSALRFANEGAKTYFEQANQLIRSTPDAPDNLSWRIAIGLGDVYRALGQYAESRAMLESGLALTETDQFTEQQKAGLYRRLGETTQKQGELEAAHEYFAHALTILGELTDPQAQSEVALILNDLAWIHYVRGHFDQAREACEASLTYARSVDALNELAAAENLLGGIYYRQSEWTAALHHTTRAMILREQMGYTWGVASTLSNLGILAVAAGHWTKARSFFERSLALRREMGDVEGVAIVHNNLGTLARDQGELDLAETHFRQSVAIATPFNIAFHSANAHIGLAQTLLLRGEHTAAQESLDTSLEQAEALGAKDMLAEIHWVQAEILAAQSRWHEAKSVATQAAELATATGNRSLELAAWRLLSEIELQNGKLRAARAALDQAQQFMAEANDDLEAGRMAAQAGRLHLYSGQLAQARHELRVAQQVFMRLGASLDLKNVEEAMKELSLSKAETNS
jgi:predicted ATPase/class 3 adenylate cyclase/Tfp pilus assembly protein PilF